MINLFLKLTGLTSARLAGSVAAFLSTVLISRSFGAEALAAFAIWMSVSGILSVIMLIGTQSLAPITFSKARAEGNRQKAQSILNLGYASTCAVVVVLMAGGGLWIASGTGIPELGWVFVYLSMICIAPLMAVLHLHGGALNGLQHHASGQLPDTLLRPFLFLSLLFATAIWFGVDSQGAILFALGVSLLVAVFVQTSSLLRAIKRLPSKTPKSNKGGIGKQRTISWLAISLLWDYQIEILMLVIAVVADPVEVALLYVCFRIRVLLGFGIKSIYQVLQPSIFAADPVKDVDLIHRQIDRINGFSLVYAFGAVVAVYVAAPLILGVFDPEFSGHGDVLLAVCLVLIGRALFGPGISLLAANEGQSTIALTLSACTVLTVIGCLAAYLEFGVLGIAISYTISCAFTAYLLRLIARRKFGLEAAAWSSVIRWTGLLRSEKQPTSNPV